MLNAWILNETAFILAPKKYNLLFWHWQIMLTCPHLQYRAYLSVTDWEISWNFERIFDGKLMCHPWGVLNSQGNVGPSGELTASPYSPTSTYPGTSSVTDRNALRTTQSALGHFPSLGRFGIHPWGTFRPWGVLESPALGRFEITKIRRRYEIQDGGNTSIQPI